MVLPVYHDYTETRGLAAVNLRSGNGCKLLCPLPFGVLETARAIPKKRPSLGNLEAPSQTPNKWM